MASIKKSTVVNAFVYDQHTKFTCNKVFEEFRRKGEEPNAFQLYSTFLEEHRRVNVHAVVGSLCLSVVLSFRLICCSMTSGKGWCRVELRHWRETVRRN